MNSPTIGLSALSAEQQRVVERHLSLAQSAARRLLRRGRRGREYRDLFQEGVVALAEAVRSHDPARHGAFPAYAMSRIHFAVSRFAQENESCIRVPFISLRRHRARRADIDEPSRRPDGPVRVLRMDDAGVRDSGRGRSRNPDEPNAPDARRPRADDSGVERLAKTMSDVLSEMRASTRGGAGYRRMVERCAEERWMIPERASQRSLRALAKELNCSVGRIARCEKTFRRKLAQRLEWVSCGRSVRRLGGRRIFVASPPAAETAAATDTRKPI